MENRDTKYWLSEGNKFYGYREYEKAIECYKEVAKLDRNNSSIIKKIYNVYLQWGDKLYKQAITKQDEFLLEKEFAINEKVNEMAERYWYLGGVNEDTFYIWGSRLHELANIKRDNKLFNEAENLYNKAIDKYDESIDNSWSFVSSGDALCELANIKLDKKIFNEAENLYNKAIEKYEKAIKLEPEYSYASIRKGIALINLADVKQDEHNLYAEATKCFVETEKSILDILVCLNKKDGEQVIRTRVLYPLLNLGTDDGNFFEKITSSLPQIECDKYKEIYILSIFIISQLRINNEYEKSVAHYTTETTARELLFNKSKFRLNAINNSNDPREGKTLLDYLFPSKDISSNDTEYKAFAGCFTFNHDSLNQFRLYGKDSYQEGTGLSLIFREDFFSKRSKMATEKDNETGADRLSKILGLEDESKKYTLFRCIYIDPKEQRVETLGQKERYIFYREMEKETAKEEYKKYKEYIDDVINTVDEKMCELKDLIQRSNLDQNVIELLLINLRYLIKHLAFKEEQECRIVKICNTNEENRMYIEYETEIFYSIKGKSDDLSHINKIYFGPKATNMESFQDSLKIKLNCKIECEKSENLLA